MKYLKFSEPFPEMILSGKKYSTWRINDEKDIIKGNVISLRRNDGSEFGRAKVTSVRETTFGGLSDEDRDGHESFASEEEMYDAYSFYYGIKINRETRIKVIRFKLL